MDLLSGRSSVMIWGAACERCGAIEATDVPHEARGETFDAVVSAMGMGWPMLIDIGLARAEIIHTDCGGGRISLTEPIRFNGLDELFAIIDAREARGEATG